MCADKICTLCKMTKPLDSYHRDGQGYRQKCKACVVIYNHARRDHLREKMNAQVKAYRKRIRDWFETLKMAPCTDCGRCFPPECMDFDHLPGSKKTDIQRLLQRSNKPAIIRELEHCELVCACCHRTRTKRRKIGGDMWSDKTIEEAKKVGMISTGTVTPEQMEAFKKAWEENILPKVRFVRTSPLAVLPARGTDGAVGYDVCAAEHKILFAGSSLPVLIDTGWKIAVQDGYEVQVRPRSGLALKKGVTVLNTPGTIDPDYRGTLGVILINHSLENFEVKPGDRIAQLVVAPVTRAAMIEVESFDDTTARGEGGYGSTGI